MQKHSLEFYKKQAKKLKKSFSDGEKAEILRVQSHLPHVKELSLADAQFIIAREHEQPTWKQFTQYIEDHLISGVQFRFHGKLKSFLKKKYRKNPILKFEAHRSVKDMIESLSIPHTEVSKVLCEGKPVSFDTRGENGNTYEVHGFAENFDPRSESIMGSPLVKEIKFLADINCGKLVRYLRIMGLNCIFEEPWDDAILAQKAHEHGAIMVSRDAGLLQRSCVNHGIYLYSDNPVEQAAEILKRFDISDQIKMMSRCVSCNSFTKPVEKASIDHLLEPGTRQNYQKFWQCQNCAKVYWRGAHFKNLNQLVLNIEKKTVSSC